MSFAIKWQNHWKKAPKQHPPAPKNSTMLAKVKTNRHVPAKNLAEECFLAHYFSGDFTRDFQRNLFTSLLIYFYITSLSLYFNLSSVVQYKYRVLHITKTKFIIFSISREDIFTHSSHAIAWRWVSSDHICFATCFCRGVAHFLSSNPDLLSKMEALASWSAG